MHLRNTLRFIGILLLFLGLSMAAPLGVSLVYADGCAMAFLYALSITVLFGLTLLILTKTAEASPLTHRDGVAVVTLGWIAAGLAGALPYLITGSIGGFTDACFESLSGFTTTGASVLPDIEHQYPFCQCG